MPKPGPLSNGRSDDKSPQDDDITPEDSDTPEIEAETVAEYPQKGPQEWKFIAQNDDAFISFTRRVEPIRRRDSEPGE